MTPSRRRALWTIGGTLALAAAGFMLERSWRRPQPLSEIAEEELRDAVASPPSSARLVMGRPAPVSYFAGPSARHAEIETALLSRRRALRRTQ